MINKKIIRSFFIIGLLCISSFAYAAYTISQGGTNNTSFTSNALTYFNGTKITSVTLGSGLSLMGGTLSSLASPYPFPLTGNATSTLTQFNGGLTAYASSTISGLIGLGGMSVQDVTGGSGSGIVAGTYGDFAGGSAGTVNTANSIVSNGTGSFAYGRADGLLIRGAIQSTGNGSIALGEASGGFSGSGGAIVSSGQGSFAGGSDDGNQGTTTASQTASFAWGTNLGATAQLATAFGSGYTNSTANSFDIGYSTTPSLTVTGSAVTSNENIYDLPQAPLISTQCLQINTSGEITNSGNPCGSSFGYLFPSNATSTALTFNGGATISTLTLNTALTQANGGTGTSTAGVTNGVEYNNGSNLTNNSGFTYNGSEVATAESLPATSTAITLNWTATPNQVNYQIGTSATTITLINATTSAMSGSTKRVWICNPNASAGTLTWAGVEWIGSAPTQTTTAGQCDIYSLDVTSATSTSAYKVAGSQGAGFQ